MSKELNRQKGVEGEDLATAYLLTKGYKILERNYSPKTNFQGGEIDIVAGKGDTIHFIEVKTRTDDRFGFGREAVTRAKQRTIRNLAIRYLVQKHLYERTSVSFDVIEIQNGQVEFIENCF